jgi:hypothetical protein
MIVCVDDLDNKWFCDTFDCVSLKYFVWAISMQTLYYMEEHKEQFQNFNEVLFKLIKEVCHNDPHHQLDWINGQSAVHWSAAMVQKLWMMQESLEQKGVSSSWDFGFPS